MATASSLAQGQGSRTPFGERLFTHGSTLIVTLSGIALAVMKYLLEPDPDGFSVYGHPWQPHALHVHVLASPLVVLALGLLWQGHVVKRLMNPDWRRNRRTGIAVLAILIVLCASGYLLQVVTHEGTRAALVVAHVAPAVLFAAAYLGHFLLAGRSAPGRGSARNGA